jgi:hypothetical protein
MWGGEHGFVVVGPAFLVCVLDVDTSDSFTDDILGA